MSTLMLRRELGKKELFGIAIGQVIGAGIMALVGIGIDMTGRSVAIAFVLSAVWVILLSVPWIFISSCIRLRGGEYTQACVLVGERYAGIYIVIFLVRNLQMAVYAMSFAGYFVKLIPGINQTLVSVLIVTFFFVLNIFPTKFMAVIQNLIVIFLSVALALFIAYGVPQIQPGYWASEGLFTHGTQGLLASSALLTFATFGASSIFQLSGECKKPKVDIPFVMIVSTLAVAIVYAIVSMVAAGVLPLSEVANENLSKVAEFILPKPIYLFFIIAGALGALATTLNATIVWVTKPILQACDDGWFPKQLSYLHPKYKTPVAILAVFYVITIIPILINFDMGSITNSVLVIMYVCLIITSLATIRLPKLFPEHWAKSAFRVPQPVLTVSCIISAIVLAVQVYYNIQFVDKRLLYANVVLLAICIVYALLRYRSGKVKINISYEND